MIYSNPEFFLLLSISLFIYAFVQYPGRLWILLIASFTFYSWSGVFDTLIFLLVVFISWLAPLMAEKFPKNKKLLITCGISVMVLHLFFWKYAPWLTRSIQYIFPSFLGGRPLVLPLPVGISFFTLQGIAYLVDYAAGKARFIPLKEYLLFKSFFAQLVAGPIVRSKQLMPQLQNLQPLQFVNLLEGLELFALGFFKKLFLAGRVSGSVDLVFLQPEQYGRFSLVLAMLGYTVQIWADFSGYTDMGRGAAKMFGVKLPENFLSPYFSKSPSEFWTRWHITLSQWIRDYIYIPLGGSQGTKLKTFLVVVITMSISGLWHGAEWTFLVWGLYHGFLLVSERICKNNFFIQRFLQIFPAPIFSFFTWILTFSCIVFGWLIFRAQGWNQFFRAMRVLFFTHDPGIPPYRVSNIYLCLLLCMLIQFLTYSNIWSQSYSRMRNFFENRNMIFSALYGILLAGFMALTLFLRGSSAQTAFIYFRF